MQPLLDAGTTGAGSPTEAAQGNELVISMVAYAPDVAEVMRGAGQAAGEPPIHLASFLKVRQREHYDALRKVQMRREWEPWIKLFLECVMASATHAVQLFGKSSPSTPPGSSNCGHRSGDTTPRSGKSQIYCRGNGSSPSTKSPGGSIPALANPSTGSAPSRCSRLTLSTSISTIVNSLHFGLETAR